MKQIFDLTCPSCGEEHPASWIPFLATSPALDPVPMPYCCKRCAVPVIIKHEEIEISDDRYQKFTLGLSLEPAYPAWLLWTPSIGEPGMFRVSSGAVHGKLEDLSRTDAFVEETVQAQDHLRVAMIGYGLQFSEANSMVIAINGNEASIDRALSLLMCTAGIPKDYIPDVHSACMLADSIADITTAVVTQMRRQPIVQDIDGVESWVHSLASSRVVDYLLRNTWFALQLEVNINRMCQHTEYRNLLQKADDGWMYFNTEIVNDVPPSWVRLYPPGYRIMSFEEFTCIVGEKISPEIHVGMAETFSPDRPVTFADRDMSESIATHKSDPTMVTGVSKKKKILH